MMRLQGGRIEMMCKLAEVSRAGFYRYLARKAPPEADMELRHQLQAIALENRFYGYRRVGAELRRKGFAVNHKKVLRMMRQDNLLVLRKRKFVATTDSKHTWAVYPNWAATVEVTGPNQLWVADLTYIRLQSEFVYLAVVLDVYSRRVAGWCLGRSLQASLCITGLERAIADRKPPPGLVHHSDRGVQYASPAYGDLLARHKMMGSMSRAGCPYDNAYCESFMKTLKQEEVDGRQYAGLEDLELHCREFIDGYYNTRRLHSALGYRSPEEYEQNQSRAAQSAPAEQQVSFTSTDDADAADQEKEGALECVF